MSKYMVKIYDASFVQDYIENSAAFFDDEETAIEYAIDITKEFIDDYIDYLEADVFVKDVGMDTYQMIGYVSYAVNTRDCDGWDKIGYDSIEFEEVYC